MFNVNSCDYKTLENFAKETTANPSFNSMLVVHINIVSLQKNFDNLKQSFSQFKRKVVVICLSETRLSDHNLSCCFLPGYRLFYCNSKTKAGRSAIYVSDVIKCKQLSIKINTDRCEDVWVELTLYQNKSLTVGSVYRHPSKVQFQTI